MNPVPAALMVAVLTVAGRWARGKEFDTETATKNAVGVGGVAIGLALLTEINKEFGEAMGLLVVISVAVWHLGPIFESVKKGLA